MSENAIQTKKFLDYEGVKYLWSKISMEDYPNNETLMAVINAIDETKADKEDIVPSDWNQNDENALDYIKNRTHYVEQIVIDPIYNGDPVGKEIVQLDPQMRYIKMSDNPIIDESYIGSQVIWVDPNGENTMTLTEYDRVTADAAFSGLVGYAIKFYGMTHILCIVEESSFGNAHFTPGTWFMDGGIMYVKSWSCLSPVSVEIVHKIPIKYLPEEVTKECEIEVISDETIDFICGRLSGWQEDDDIITDENNSVLLFTNY